ncbi:MAG: hypothetical protein FWC43_05650 [Planctomycetaceae bacterium]|nr:hypothetical protein [Planctomycetaceae bacterium]
MATIKGLIDKSGVLELLNSPAIKMAREIQSRLDEFQHVRQLTDSFNNLKKSLFPMPLTLEQYDQLIENYRRISESWDPIIARLKKRKKHYEKLLNSSESNSKTPKQKANVEYHKSVTEMLLSISEHSKASYKMQENTYALQRENQVSDKERSEREKQTFRFLRISYRTTCLIGVATLVVAAISLFRPPKVNIPTIEIPTVEVKLLHEHRHVKQNNVTR